MSPRCRVTFFDSAHQIRRTLDVEAGLPLAAAEIALSRLIANHVALENLGPAVKVEVISTTECCLPLRSLTAPVAAFPKAKVA